MKMSRSNYSRTTIFFTLIWLFASGISPGQQTTLEYKKLPAVFVAGNMEGIVPIASEAAVYLAELVLADQSRYVDKNAYYVIPVVNVDGTYHFY
ncbi:MAG: hypothetical protein IIB05_08645 [Bacteroidetes bacterium]|nr:hypothetical protein [Bacteroidota bacterium]